MGARQRLTLLAAASGAILIVLGRTAHGAAEQLVQVPPQAWGLSDLSNAVVAGTCTCGALGALWHAVSALLALMTCPGANDPGKRCRGGAYALAARALEAWGAPAVRRKPVSRLDTAGQPGGAAPYRPRRPTLLEPHSYRRARREPVVHHRSPPAHRLRPRTDRTGLASPVPRQLRGHRRRPLADPARHGPERPGLLVRTEHTGRRSGAITMNRTAPAPAAPTAGPEHLPHSTSHSVPTGHPPTPRSPP